MSEDTVRKEFEQLADDNQLHGIARITCGNYFMEGYDRGRSAMAKEAAQACEKVQEFGKDADYGPYERAAKQCVLAILALAEKDNVR